AQVPVVDPANLAGTMHPPLRKAILAELSRRDPSLAYRAASHLWARDLARLATVSSRLAQAARRWERGDEWACFALLERRPGSNGEGVSEAFFVPAAGAQSILILWDDRLFVWNSSAATTGQSLAVEPVASLGLRGA